MSHWIFKGCYHEFIVENIQKWDPHPINIVNIETIKKLYTVLAEGERGPQIAEHFNTIAIQFPIRAKHPETIKLLQNFITNALTRISNEDKVGVNLREAYDIYDLKKAKIKNGVDLSAEQESTSRPFNSKSKISNS